MLSFERLYDHHRHPVVVVVVVICCLVAISSSANTNSTSEDHYNDDTTLMASNNMYDHENRTSRYSVSSSAASSSNNSEIITSRISSSNRWMPVIINVEDFRKQSNNDDTVAFKKAWNKACDTPNGALLVPHNKIYRLKPVKFSGPCKSRTLVQIKGIIEASSDMSDYHKDRRHWISFQNLKHLIVMGGGTIDGKGHVWWINSCKIDKTKPCIGAPTAVTFYEIKNLRVRDMTIKNAQQMHMTFQKCVNVKTMNVHISSPESSPNTDGIHVTASRNVRIHNSIIKTGDDCISIVSGSKNIIASDIKCGPGHGISIGSLGKDNTVARVSNILINGATFTRTMNGVRIKTWQGGSGYARSITFRNIVMRDVSNPIIIDQNYCDQEGPCKQQKSAVQVSKINFTNIKGTSESEVAVKFDCSRNRPCEQVVMKNVELVRGESGGSGSVKAVCVNAGVSKIGKVVPSC